MIHGQEIKANHEKWMNRSLSLAIQGLNGASPNPYVGCVLVKNNRLISKGAHLRFGGPHAEVNALRAAGPKARGSKLYVNLEPCSHWGKTPPCADLIIRSGVSQVIVGMVDPNPLVRGKGIAALRRAGIRVLTRIRSKEAMDLNRSFIKYITQKQPYVYLKTACSLDGKIGSVSGQSKWITSAESRAYSHGLRSQMDAVLIGANTLRKDRPSLTSHGQGRNPVRVILTASGQIPSPAAPPDQGSVTWVIHSNPSFKLKTTPGAEWFYLPGNSKGIPFARILDFLGNRGISRLLIEGGGTTSAAALESNCVDEIIFFYAPILIGGKGAKSVFDGNGFKDLLQAPKVQDLKIKKIGPDLILNGRIRSQG